MLKDCGWHILPLVERLSEPRPCWNGCADPREPPADFRRRARSWRRRSGRCLREMQGWSVSRRTLRGGERQESVEGEGVSGRKLPLFPVALRAACRCVCSPPPGGPGEQVCCQEHRLVLLRKGPQQPLEAPCPCLPGGGPQFSGQSQTVPHALGAGRCPPSSSVASCREGGRPRVDGEAAKRTNTAVPTGWRLAGEIWVFCWDSFSQG